MKIINGPYLNIVFSTTRQWNPGDEFILFGCIQALKHAGLNFNPMIFNRNPQIRPIKKGNLFLKKLDSWLLGGHLFPFLDNSIKDSTDSSVINLVVFAGSPEWRGKRLSPLYRQILENNIPVLFLGLGTNRPFSFSRTHFSDDEIRVFQNAKLITCRDSLTTAALKPLPSVQLTCPALLSSPYAQVRTEVKRIAFIYGSHKAVKNNNVSPETFRYLKKLYEALLQHFNNRFEVEFVAHYIDEVPLFYQDFPRYNLRYSFDSRDYLEIYSRYDIVIGHRIHGIGVSASHGIPGICLVHDKRGETARGFGAEMITHDTQVDSVIKMVERLSQDPSAASQRIITEKENLLARYSSEIRRALDPAPLDNI